LADKPVALDSRIELEFGNVVLEEGGKTTEYPEKKTLGARTRTNNKLNPHMTLGWRIKPGPYWWEASALTISLPFARTVVMQK